MFGLFNENYNSLGVKSLDQTISVSNTVAKTSITKASSGNNEEIFVIPRNSLSTDGKYARLLILSRWANNNGSQNTAFEVTVGGVLVYSSITFPLAASAYPRAHFLDLRFIRLSSSNLLSILNFTISAFAGANVAVSGTPIGSFGGGTQCIAATNASAFNPTIDNTIVVNATHSLADASVSLSPWYRSLTIG